MEDCYDCFELETYQETYTNPYRPQRGNERLKADLLELAERRETSMRNKMEELRVKKKMKEKKPENHLLWLLSVIFAGFVVRILIFQAFQWFWEFLEADAYELCQNMGNRNQCVDSSS